MAAFILCVSILVAMFKSEYELIVIGCAVAFFENREVNL